jgi:hypothetical protein
MVSDMMRWWWCQGCDDGHHPISLMIEEGRGGAADPCHRRSWQAVGETERQ